MTRGISITDTRIIGVRVAPALDSTVSKIVVRRALSEKEGVIKDTTKGKTYRMIEMNGDMRAILERRIARAASPTVPLFNTLRLLTAPQLK
ncbi:MAG: hypothetical protein NTY08_10675 [Proteobacteria bacterium]|nr:hypothetical protein [Pseudomonadota bacterium]